MTPFPTRWELYTQESGHPKRRPSLNHSNCKERDCRFLTTKMCWCRASSTGPIRNQSKKKGIGTESSRSHGKHFSLRLTPSGTATSRDGNRRTPRITVCATVGKANYPRADRRDAACPTATLLHADQATQSSGCDLRPLDVGRSESREGARLMIVWITKWLRTASR